jgi:hypothetical protein
MKRILLWLIPTILLSYDSSAQFTRYIVKLQNKGATTFSLNNPTAYLSARALARRTRYAISVDSADLPVPATYLSQIRSIPNVTILNVSKWLNAVAILTGDPAAITAINALPFVQSTSPLAARVANQRIDKFNTSPVEELPVPPNERVTGTQGDFFNYGTSSYNEIHLHKGEFLHNIGLRGQGMQIAMLDAGFFNYTTLKAFDSINLNGQVLGTWDFVNREASVVEDFYHGMQCLSTIAANIPGQFVGKAPKASFYLFRTEDAATEYPIEEFNWVCGAELSDSLGADVISSSLGYNTFDNSVFDHTYSQMDGKTTMCATGARMAAKKGLLIFNANGNEGTNTWHFLITPADADSILAVGAVTSTGVVGSFSSYGPSADGRVKPDVSSIGVAAIVQNTNNTIGTSNGTSFACPNMAGLGTCLWQGFPEFNNARIVRALKEAGTIYTAPNNRIGYGIPDMKAAFASLLTDYATSSVTVTNCTATLTWNSKDVDAMRYEVERKAPGETSFTKIADVSAQAGNVLANHAYTFNNTLTVPAGNLAYRIRQVIDTNAATFTAVYIDTATINLASSCTTTGVNGPDPNADRIWVQPNPAGANTTLIVQTTNAIPSMPVKIYDMKGRLVLDMQLAKGAGKVTIDLPVDKLSKGKYLVAVYNGRIIIGTTGLLKL